MKTEEFKRAYNETRNGANLFVRHWANQKFQYSDGVEECADCGLYWFLDALLAEVATLCPLGDLGETHLKVQDGVGHAFLMLRDDAPPAWERKGIRTDCPDGDWVFYLFNEGERIAMILPSEY
jgi:hypothetical protein